MTWAQTEAFNCAIIIISMKFLIVFKRKLTKDLIAIRLLFRAIKVSKKVTR